MARVCQLTDDLKYYLCMEPVDMRKQFQGHQGIVHEEFGRYLTQDEAFIFIGKTRKTVKVLHRESDGLTLYVRKLSDGRFQIPRLNDDNRTITLTPDEFTLLILGEKWYSETPREVSGTVLDTLILGEKWYSETPTPYSFSKEKYLILGEKWYSETP